MIAVQLKTMVSESGLENVTLKPQEPVIARQPITGKETAERSAETLENDHRQYVVEIIRDMINKGETYGQIAKQLQSRGVATLTGRGNWRPQKISRLYRQTF